MKQNHVGMLLRMAIFLLLNFAALALGGLFTSTGVKSQWYENLLKAPWTPPGWVFGFAWTTIMVCFSFYLSFLWNLVSDKKTLVLLYALQWVLNVAWNPLFFYYHQTNVALVSISLLTLLVVYLFFAHIKLLHVKSVYLLPYVLWLFIATSLNAFICMYNRI